MSGGEFTFPELEISQIRDFFNALHEITVTEDDIKKPQAPLIQKLYKICFEEIVSVSLDEVCQSSFANLQNLEYPEIHERASYMRNFALAVQFLLTKCGLENFSVRDLVEPKPKATRRFLSGLINFYYFSQERLPVYEKLQKERETELEHISHLVKTNGELQKQINHIKARRAEQLPEIQKYEEENRRLESEMAEKQKQANNLKKANEVYQSKIQEITAKTEQKKLDKLQIQEERDELAAKIVKSPDRMKREQENMYQQQRELKAKLEESQQRLLETQQRYVKKQEWLDEFDSVSRQLQSLYDQVSSERELARKVTKVQEDRQALSADLQKMKRNAELPTQQIDKKQDKLNKQRLLHKKKMAELEDELVASKGEKEKLEQLLSEDQAEAHAYEEKLKDEIARGWKKVEQENVLTEKMRKKFVDITESLDSYHTQLAASWEAATNLDHRG